ncbi:MAG TPA: DUF1971 domain-containing protein [Allosphingosinicella sp.]
MQAPATSLPGSVVSYRRTPEFSEATVPAGLKRAHSTKEGVWGLIHVLDGRLRYRILDERREPAELMLMPGLPPGIVEPTILHEVEPVGPVRFQVEFFRAGG